MELTDLQQAQAVVAEKWYVDEECGYCGRSGRIYNPKTDNFFPQPDTACPFCTGTGKVRRWPMRVECPWNTGYKHPGGITYQREYFEQRSHNEGNCPCHGLGWVPCTDAMVLARESNLQGMKRWFQEGGHGWLFAWPVRSFDPITYSGEVFIETDDPELALFQAAEKWYVERSA